MTRTFSAADLVCDVPGMPTDVSRRIGRWQVSGGSYESLLESKKYPGHAHSGME